MNRSRNAARWRPQVSWLHATVAFLLAMTAIAPGFAPSAGAAVEKDIVACAASSTEGIYGDPDNCRIYYRPDHPVAYLTLTVGTNFQGAVATFPTLFGVPGGEVTTSKKKGKRWSLNYQIPAGATDSGSKEVHVAAADGSGAGEAIPIYSDSVGPEMEFTAPAANAQVEPGKKFTVTAEGYDQSDPGQQASEIFSVELFEVGTRGGQAYTQSIGTAWVSPYRFPKAKVSEDAEGLMLRSTDNVGNVTDSEVLPICVGDCNAPPPGKVNPDNRDTAQPVTRLPYSLDIETSELTSSPSDPTCIDETGEEAPYDHSAWFALTLPRDTDVWVTTEDSSWYADYEYELDTVMLVGFVPDGGGEFTVMECIDDDEEEDSEAAYLMFEAHAGVTYYVMAGTFRDPDERGTLAVDFRVDE